MSEGVVVRTIRWMFVVFWVVVALWVVREYAPGVGHDVQVEDQSVLVEDLGRLGGS